MIGRVFGKAVLTCSTTRTGSRRQKDDSVTPNETPTALQPLQSGSEALRCAVPDAVQLVGVKHGAEMGLISTRTIYICELSGLGAMPVR